MTKLELNQIKQRIESLQRGITTAIPTGSGLSNYINPLPQVQGSITCDCGALKCKTTHSHWCSVIQKGVK